MVSFLCPPPRPDLTSGPWRPGAIANGQKAGGWGKPWRGGGGGNPPQDWASQEDPGGAPGTQWVKAQPRDLLTQPGKQLRQGLDVFLQGCLRFLDLALHLIQPGTHLWEGGWERENREVLEGLPLAPGPGESGWKHTHLLSSLQLPSARSCGEQLPGGLQERGPRLAGQPAGPLVLLLPLPQQGLGELWVGGSAGRRG